MINRKDILEILSAEFPTLKIAINLNTMTIIDNPQNFIMPNDKELQRLADKYDAAKLVEKDRVILQQQRLAALELNLDDLKKLLK